MSNMKVEVSYAQWPHETVTTCGWVRVNLYDKFFEMNYFLVENIHSTFFPQSRFFSLNFNFHNMGEFFNKSTIKLPLGGCSTPSLTPPCNRAPGYTTNITRVTKERRRELMAIAYL